MIPPLAVWGEILAAKRHTFSWTNYDEIIRKGREEEGRTWRLNGRGVEEVQGRIQD